MFWKRKRRIPSPPLIVRCPMCDADWVTEKGQRFQCNICGEPMDATKLYRAQYKAKLVLIPGGKK